MQELIADFVSQQEPHDDLTNNCRHFSRGLVTVLNTHGYDAEILLVQGIQKDDQEFVHEVVITTDEPVWVIEPQTGQMWSEEEAEQYFIRTYRLRDLLTISLGKMLG